MADLYTIKGTAAEGQLVVDATCGLYNYQDEVQDVDGEGKPLGLIPNPESKVDFTKRMLLRHLKGLVTSWAVKGAEVTKKELREAAEADIDGLSTN
jgi:hypothetical protein